MRPRASFEHPARDARLDLVDRLSVTAVVVPKPKGFALHTKRLQHTLRPNMPRVGARMSERMQYPPTARARRTKRTSERMGYPPHAMLTTFFRPEAGFD